MSAPPRPDARSFRLTRRTVARSSVLGLGLLVAAGTTPAAAVAVQDGDGTGPSADTVDAQARLAGAPLNVVPAGNQGTAGQGNPGQGNPNPGGDTPGNNTPGTNDAGHPNGGTGASDGGAGDPADGGTDDGGDGDVVPAPLVPDFGTGKQFDLAVSTTGPVPEDLQLSGAQFTFTPVSVLPFPVGEAAHPTPPPAPVTCTTDAAGTCTVGGAFAVASVSDDGSDVRLPFGSYEVTQSRAIPGLKSASWAGADLTICFLGCDLTKPIAVTNPSLFRQQVIGTVVDQTGAVAAGAEFALDGTDFPRRPVDPAGAGPTLPAVATSDGAGVVVFDGWFAPGDWTFTSTDTTPDGLPRLAETHALATTVAEAESATPWEVSLTLATEQAAGEGGTGDGDGTGEGAGTGEGEGAGEGVGTDGGDTDGAEGPGTEGPGRPVPGNPGNPGTPGHPGTIDPGGGNHAVPPVPAAVPAPPGQAGDGVGPSESPSENEQPVGRTAPTTGPAPKTPPSGATTSPPGNRAAPSLPPDFVLSEPSPELETVSLGLREAGFAAFAVVFLGTVFFGLLFFRRRARRKR